MKCGYVAVLGKPNAGKSSLVNALVGEEVAIVSHRRQTTRNSILGIRNGEGYQIIFIDTPGIHHSENKLDKFMMKNVRSAIASADVVLYLFDGTKPLEQEEIDYMKMLQEKCEKLIFVKTKADKKQQDFQVDALSISVQNGQNMQTILEKIVEMLPQQNAIYDEEQYTDKSVNFLIAEKVRGFLLNNIDKEIPHGVAVVVTRFFEEENLVNVDVEIVCEREQHKGIIIGKGGNMLKKLGAETRAYIEDLLQKKCMLKLFVKVDSNWRMKNIEQYGY